MKSILFDIVFLPLFFAVAAVIYIVVALVFGFYSLYTYIRGNN